MRFEFQGLMWLHDAEAGWHFITLPTDLGADIAAMTAGARRGFGSLRVDASIAGVSWATSIFPDTPSGSFLLPVRKGVRDAAGIVDGDRLDITITLRDF